MKKEYIFLIILMAAMKLTPASATHGLIMWQSIMDKPKFARVSLDSSYTHLTDTPVGLIHFYDTMDKIATWQEMIVENNAMKDTAWSIRNSMYAMSSGFLSWGDTNSLLATKYGLSVENKAMKDTAYVLRNLISASVPVLTNYLHWGDTSTRIATKYNINQTAQAWRDTALALRTFVYSSLLAYPKWSDTSTRLSSIKRLMDTAVAIRLSIPKPDYYNSATTTSGTATFYLTSNKLSSGTALYSQINYVNPLVNNVNGNYTFGWTVSGDFKTLTVQSRVATNTAVIALLGISLLSSTVQVPNGTEIQVLVKGQ